jgi:hypothetical protein
MRRMVLPIIGLQGLHSQLIQVISSEETQICVSMLNWWYLTPRDTELMAASLKDSSGS